MKIYALTGQSNALGTTDDPAQIGALPDPDPYDQSIPFWWSNLGPHSDPQGDCNGSIQSLQTQPSRDANNPIWWGPEFGFARALYHAGERDFLIIKACRGGGGNTHWSKSHTGAMYNLLVTQMRDAIKAVTSTGQPATVAGLLYLQGESNNTEEAEVADDRLTTLIQDLQHDVPHADHMRLAIGGIAAQGDNRDIVRHRQASLAASNPMVSYFDTTDLRDHLYDDLHFDKAAKIIVGQRFADALL